MAPDDGLIAETEQVAHYLRTVRLALRRHTDYQIAQSGLTSPQVSVMRTLGSENGLSLKELSARIGLAHSTVSGIVDRLERQQLVERRPDPDDGRFTRIYLTDPVAEYAKGIGPLSYNTPLVNAMQHAQPDERARILDGLATLCRLLEAYPIDVKKT